MPANSLDRRSRPRQALSLARRRFPRFQLPCAVFYESATLETHAESVDLGLRGLFLPCVIADGEGTRGTVRVDTGTGPLLRIRVEVIRARKGARPGMALRIVEMSDADRRRLAALLMMAGGVGALPQLERRFATLARARHPVQLGNA